MQGGWHLLGASHNRGHVSEWGVPSFTCQVRRCCKQPCMQAHATVHAGAQTPCMQEQRSRAECAARLHAGAQQPCSCRSREAMQHACMPSLTFLSGLRNDMAAMLICRHRGAWQQALWSALPESHTFRGAQAGHDCRAWLPGVAAAHCHGAIGTYSCPILIIVYAQANLLNLNPLNLGLSSPGGPRCRQEAPREGQAKAAAVGWASWRAAAAAGEEPAGLQGAAGSLPLSRSAAGWKAPGRLHRFGRSCPLL